uniref:Uncharacterized protein n=1 Tax=viral metagenome TaxID=1070528 RepID=A0A6C0E6X2_9ZZZZ
MATYLQNDYLSIIWIFVVVFILFAVLIIIHVKKIDFNKYVYPPKLVQEVTLETMQSINISPSNGFCESYFGKTNELEKACNALTEKRCSETDCCVYTSSSKCSAGTIDGATYKSDTYGNTLHHDYYYYKNKCYGNCNQ